MKSIIILLLLSSIVALSSNSGIPGDQVSTKVFQSENQKANINLTTDPSNLWCKLTEIGNFIQFSSILLAFIGLFFMLREAKHARESSSSANVEYSKAINLIQQYGNLVQEYKGTILNWSDMVKALGEEVINENTSIKMAMDTLAYGKTSVPNSFVLFWSALLSKAAKKVNIDVVIFDDTEVLQMLREQFSEDDYNDTVDKFIHGHNQCITSLETEGGDTVTITKSPYFALQLFIFEQNEVAIFSFYELIGDGTPRVYSIRSKDARLIEICRKSFLKTKEHAINANKKASANDKNT